MMRDPFNRGGKSNAIVILTGAGISKESGLDTFRDADGIWTKVRLEDVATADAYVRDPVGVLAFYNARRRNVLADNVRANAAHDALVRLENEWPGAVLVVSQNVDNLHEMAGSRNLVHMHGELCKVRCTACSNVIECQDDLDTTTACAACAAIGTMRPHVVWYGEMPFDMDRIYAALSTCGLFVSIGTSGNTYPAAGFVEEARRTANAHTVELNLEPSEGHSLFAERRYGPATEIVPAFVDEVLAKGW